MNNKMANDYMDSLIKEIYSLQAENAKLRGQVEKMKCCPNCKEYNYCCGTWEDNVCGSWTMREDEE